MKKNVLLLCFLVVLKIVEAQSFNFGLKGGASLTDLSYNQKEGLNIDMGQEFNIGFFARLYFNEKVYLQSEFAYSFAKFEFAFDMQNIEQGTLISDNVQSFNANKQGIIVPILVGYKLIDLKVANLRVFVGPEFMFNTSDFDELIVDLQGIGQTFKSNSLVVYGLAGVGVDVLMFSIDLRYTYPFGSDFVIDSHKTDFKDCWKLALTWRIF